MSNIMNSSAIATNALDLMLSNTNLSYEGHLNYTIWNDTLGILTFDPSKTNLSIIIDSIGPLFKPDVFTFRQLCVYPISGQYGFLPRLLYYLLLFFSFILRKHEWLSAGALAVAMAYSSAACVHIFALFVLYDYHNFDVTHVRDPQAHVLPPQHYGDIDLVAIFPILVAGCIMLPPILNWSEVVRKHEARAVVIYWGTLIFLTTILILRTIFHWGFPYMIVTQVASCPINDSKGCNASAFLNPELFISSNFYRKCGCSDNCGAITMPGTPLRKGSTFQAFRLEDNIIQAVSSKSLIPLFYTNIGFLIFIVFQGVLSLFKAQWEQREVRNWIFRTLMGRNLPATQSGIKSKPRYFFAKSTAALFYLADILVAIVSPVVFISSIITNEITVQIYPVSEYSDAVGQWNSWASVGFVILGTLIQRYHSTWIGLVKLTCFTIERLVKSLFNRAKRQVDSWPADQDNNKLFTENLWIVFGLCKRPFAHSGRSIERSWKRIQAEWHDYKDWWKNPISVATAMSGREKVTDVAPQNA